MSVKFSLSMIKDHTLLKKKLQQLFISGTSLTPIDSKHSATP